MKWTGNILHHAGCQVTAGTIRGELQKFTGRTQNAGIRQAPTLSVNGKTTWILHLFDEDPYRMSEDEPITAIVWIGCSPKEAREESERIIEWALSHPDHAPRLTNTESNQ